MAEEEKAKLKFEIGHVLFIDIVGYSKLLINEQSEQIQTLKKIVRGTEQCRIAEAEDKLLRLPTGDGGALVFRTLSFGRTGLTDGCIQKIVARILATVASGIFPNRSGKLYSRNQLFDWKRLYCVPGCTTIEGWGFRRRRSRFWCAFQPLSRKQRAKFPS